MEATCAGCGLIFPATDDHFYRSSKPSGKLRSKCKSCHKAVAAASARRRRKTPEGLEQARRRMFRYVTGLTHEQRDDLLAQQGGVCAICGTDQPGPRGWAVDHDHSCCSGTRQCGSCRRGILCGPCNQALGLFRDNESILSSAMAYLNKEKAVTV